MKSQTNKHGAISNYNQAKEQHSNSVDDSSHVKCSSKNIRKHKRKASPSPLEDRSYALEQSQSKPKFKSKKERKNEIDSFSGIEIGISDKSEEDNKTQDNTPKSLKKKKLKKKKNKSNPTSVHPNTYYLDYLKKWKTDRSQWKFEKVKQIRLITHMFDVQKLPDDYFSIFLEYVEGGSNSMKELVSKLANEVIEEMEKWQSLSDTEKETTAMVDETKYKRARTVIQLLQ